MSFDRELYTINVSEEEKKYLIENMEYLKLRRHQYAKTIFDIINENKFKVEENIDITNEKGCNQWLVPLTGMRKYIELGEIGKATYTEMLEKLNTYLDKRKLTKNDLRMVQKFSYFFWVFKVSFEKGNLILQHRGVGTHLDSLVYFLFNCIKGYDCDYKEREVLINKYNLHAYESNNVIIEELASIKIRTYKNGKIVVNGFDEQASKYIVNLLDNKARLEDGAVHYTWIC